MSRRYLPAWRVLPELTDESLTSPGTLFGPELVELLLTLPPEYRQLFLIETRRRSTHVVDNGRGRRVEECARSRDEVNAEVAGEILAQLRTERQNESPPTAP